MRRALYFIVLPALLVCICSEPDDVAEAQCDLNVKGPVSLEKSKRPRILDTGSEIVIPYFDQGSNHLEDFHPTIPVFTIPVLWQKIYIY